MPLNILAGIGGMSEFTMMTEGIRWPIAYGLFTVGLVLVGWLTYVLLHVLEKREYRQARRRD
jgi:magnesium transporter